MPGNFKNIIVFPFEFDGARSSRIQLEPFVCVNCYGISIKIILELVGGSGDNTFYYERVAYEDSLTQENIRDGFMASPFIETMEAFYYNKTDVNVLVPVCALLLRVYFDDLLKAFNINLDSFVSDIEYVKEDIGFKSKVNYNVSNNKTNKSSYKKETTITPFGNKGNDKEEDCPTCKQILKSICQKSKKAQVRF